MPVQRGFCLPSAPDFVDIHALVVDEFHDDYGPGQVIAVFLLVAHVFSGFGVDQLWMVQHLRPWRAETLITFAIQGERAFSEGDIKYVFSLSNPQSSLLHFNTCLYLYI